MITITGATGQLGGLVIEQLLQKVAANQIVAISRSLEKAVGLAEKGVVVRQADYDNREALITALADTEVLLFVSNTDFTRREEQHKNVVDAAKQAGVNRVVYTSFVQTENRDPLTLSHANTEEYIMAADLPFTFLRNNFYMDMYVGKVETVIKNKVYRSPKPVDVGAALVSRTDIAYVATAVLTGNDHVGQIYNLTGPATVTPTVIVETAANISGESIIYQPITWEELAEDYKKRGLPAEVVSMAVMLEKFIASNTLANVSDDIEKITGHPAQAFEAYVRQALNK